MKVGSDLTFETADIFIVHQNIPGRRVSWHEHPDHHVFLPLQGEISVTVGKVSIRCGPGRMIYVPPGIRHRFDSNHAKGERLICNLKSFVWPKSMSPLKEAVVVSQNKLFAEILFYFLLNGPGSDTSALASALGQLLIRSLTDEKSVSSVDHLVSAIKDARLRRFVELVAENIGADVSLEALARRSGLSVRTLNRTAIEQTGLTPRQIRLQLQIEEAKKLLHSSQENLAQVACAVGFASQSAFIQSFKKVTGRLPSDYRRLAK